MNTFDLEKKFHAFAVAHVYLSYGVAWGPWSTKEDQAIKGDVWLRLKSGKTINIDEKAYQTVWSDCLIELVQDGDSMSPGWFHTLTQCDYLLCGYYDDASRDSPTLVYTVDWNKLKAQYATMRKAKDIRLHFLTTSKNFGTTQCATIPYDLLLTMKIAKPVDYKPSTDIALTDAKLKEFAEVAWEHPPQSEPGWLTR